MLLHVAATSSSDGTVRENERRIKHLEDALHFASLASHRAPQSLSCAALRATALLHLLVEHRSVLDGAQNQGQLLRQSGQYAQLVQDASSAAKTALTAPHAREPVIAISARGLRSYDPCCSVCVCRTAVLLRSWGEVLTGGPCAAAAGERACLGPRRGVAGVSAAASVSLPYAN